VKSEEPGRRKLGGADESEAEENGVKSEEEESGKKSRFQDGSRRREAGVEREECGCWALRKRGRAKAAEESEAGESVRKSRLQDGRRSEAGVESEECGCWGLPAAGGDTGGCGAGGAGIYCVAGRVGRGVRARMVALVGICNRWRINRCRQRILQKENTMEGR
jgi:hypothetical protein